MEKQNLYIRAAYELYVIKDGKRELVERATEAQPFLFVSGMGMALDDFEAKIVPLQKGEKFDFTLAPEQAYGPRFEEAVQELPRSAFEIDGQLNTEYVHVGAIVPLQNGAGERFNGTVTEITDETVTVDLNHPWAGCSMQFIGFVTENREATMQEIEQMANMMSEECSGCGGECGGSCGGCGGGCGGCK